MLRGLHPTPARRGRTRAAMTAWAAEASTARGGAGGRGNGRSTPGRLGFGGAACTADRAGGIEGILTAGRSPDSAESLAGAPAPGWCEGLFSSGAMGLRLPCRNSVGFRFAGTLIAAVGAKPAACGKDPELEAEEACEQDDDDCRHSPGSAQIASLGHGGPQR